MTINAALRAHLLGDAGIAALVTQRIYPLRLPQKAVMPAIVFTKISAFRWGHLRGQGSLARPRFQVDSWDSTNDGAVALGALCRRRLEGYQGVWADGESPETTINVSVQFQDEREFFEEEILGGLCRHSADYFLFHSTAAGVL